MKNKECNQDVVEDIFSKLHMEIQHAEGEEQQKILDRILDETSKIASMKEKQEEAYPYHPMYREGYDYGSFYEDEKPKSKVKAIIVGTFFYSLLIFAVAAVYFFSTPNTKEPKTVLGITVMHVLTGSMRDVMPVGTVIITREVEPETLKIGDDITYLQESNRAITHRIIDIRENYAEGQRGFETQGTANPNPDKEIVPAKNVVGKVIFHNHTLGQVVLFIRKHILWVGALLVLSIAFIAVMRKLMKKQDSEYVERRHVRNGRAYQIANERDS